MIRLVHTPPPRKLCLLCPGCLGECRGPCGAESIWVLQNLSPSSHLAQADIKFICIPHAPAWQMVGEEAGCVLGAAARDQAGASRATAECPPPCPMGQARAGAVPNTGVPPQPHSLKSAGCWDLTFDFFLRTKGALQFQEEDNVEMWGNGDCLLQS